MAVSLLLSPLAVADDSPALAPPPELPTLARAASRGVWVVATNSLAKLHLLRWVDTRIDRIEQLTGIARTSLGRTLRIVQQPAGAGLPAVSASQRLEHSLVAQTLVVRGDDDFDRAAADGGLCRLLVYGYVLDFGSGAAAGRTDADWVTEAVPAAVPVWLWRGLAGCLDSANRGDSSDRLLAAWRGGTLPPLVGFLRAGGRVTPGETGGALADNPLQLAYETMLVSWLLNQDDARTSLEALFARLAAGEPITPETLLANRSDGGSVVDLEEQWDAWILAQSRMIYAPGRTRPLDVERLREELILDRSLLGIPAESGFPVRGTFRDLLEHRKAPWLPTVASMKSLRLHTLALGKGDTYARAVEAYCAYLAALGERRRESQLEALLTTAEEAQRALEQAMRGDDAAP